VLVQHHIPKSSRMHCSNEVRLPVKSGTVGS
jgi:hypothetical protein